MTKLALLICSEAGNNTIELDHKEYLYDTPIDFCHHAPKAMQKDLGENFTYYYLRLDEEGNEVSRSNPYIVTHKIEDVSAALALTTAELAACANLLSRIGGIDNGSYNGNLLTNLQQLLVNSGEEIGVYLKTWKKSTGRPLVVYYDKKGQPQYTSSLDRVYSLDGTQLVNN